LSQGALTDRPNFRFEPHDLDIIHRAVRAFPHFFESGQIPESTLF